MNREIQDLQNKYNQAEEKVKTQVREFIADLENPIKRAERLKNAPLNVKFILDPEEYARDAILVLEDQLRTARGKNKIQKLNNRIRDWKKRLAVLESIEEKNNEG